VAGVSSSTLFVVVSGLAASGKTSLAEPLAQALGLPLISKDAIKEALFEAVGYGGLSQSKTVSRAADAAMVRIAQDFEGAVLDNFWYGETVDELLAPLPRPIVEVFCRCDPEVAYERFRGRVRYPGHADPERNPDSVRAAFFTRAKKLPLRTLGPIVEVNTERPLDVALVATRVAEAANRA
jgi:thymidylate kinase